MITASFVGSGGRLVSAEISGHSGYGDIGTDIVCAAVSSAVSLVCNTLLDVMHEPAEASEHNNRVLLKLENNCGKPAFQLMRGLYEQLLAVQAEYPQNLRVKLERKQNVTGGK